MCVCVYNVAKLESEESVDACVYNVAKLESEESVRCVCVQCS